MTTCTVVYKDVELFLKSKHDGTDSCHKCVAENNNTLCNLIHQKVEGLLCGEEEIIWKVKDIQ